MDLYADLMDDITDIVMDYYVDKIGMIILFNVIIHTYLAVVSWRMEHYNFSVSGPIKKNI